MEKNNKKVLFKIRNLKKYFPIKKKSIFSRGANEYVHANENISIDIFEGETFGLVGESGCGKSTFGRTSFKFMNKLKEQPYIMEQPLINLPQLIWERI